MNDPKDKIINYIKLYIYTHTHTHTHTDHRTRCLVVKALCYKPKGCWAETILDEYIYQFT
jgi:hypothetical protein